MNYTLEDLKEYIDDTYGKDNGDVVSNKIRCRYNEKGNLELIMFDGTVDDMVPVASLDSNFVIYYDLRGYSTPFLDYVEEFVCDEEGNCNIEDLFDGLLGVIICDYEEHKSTIDSVLEKLNEIKGGN